MSFEVLHEQFCIEFQCFALRVSKRNTEIQRTSQIERFVLDYVQ